MVNRNNIKNRKRTRLREYDYSTAGWYNVTICTKDHIFHFGKVEKDKMILNALGKTADECWNNITSHYPNINLDEYIIMPNHLHGIIIIDYNNNVGNENFRSLQHKTNLSNIIKGFKIGVTKWCKSNNYNNFKWQKFFMIE